MKARLQAGAGLAPFLLLWPAPARAHLIGVEFGPFYAGGLHVVTGIEYMAMLLGISLLAALQPREVARWVLVLSPPALLAGAIFSGVIRWSASVEMSVILLLALIGVACALRPPLKPVQLSLVAVVAAGCVGYVNGLAVESGGSVPWLHASGVAATGGVVVTLATAVFTGLAARAPVLELFYRVAGSWIGALGLIMFSLMVTGRAA